MARNDPSPSAGEVSDRPYGDETPRRRRATIRSAFSEIIVDESDTARYLWFGYARQAGVRLEQGVFDFGTALASSQRALDLAGLYQPAPDSILHLGLGAGNAPMRDALRHPHATVDVVEVDPAIPAVARDWFGFNDERCAVHLSDARAFLRASDRRWERIVFDAYLGAGGTSELNVYPGYFTERAFVELLAERISSSGFLVANVNGALRGVESAPLLALLETIQEVFGQLALHSVADRTTDNFAITEHPDMSLPDEHYIVIASRTQVPNRDEVVQLATATQGSGFVDGDIVTFARNRIDVWRAAP
jgi:spermidine synthase